MTRTLLFATLLLASAASAAGQEPPEFVLPSKLSLVDALKMATERNPTLAAARNGVEIAAAQRVDATLRPNPALSFETANYSLFANPRSPIPPAGELTIRVDQEIELAGRRRLRSDVADAAASVAESVVADERRRLDFQVRQAYFAVVLARTDLDVARGTLDEIDQVIKLTRARYDQGEISGGELRRIQVERLKFVEDVFSSQLALRNARGALLALLNAPDLGAEFDVSETLAPATTTGPVSAPAPLDAKALRGLAFGLRPDLAAAQRNLQRADTETRLQRALRTPNLTFGGGYRRDSATNGIVFGVTLPLPVANRNQGGVLRADADRRRASNLEAAVRAEVLLDVQRALNSVEVNRQRVAYIEQEYLTPSRESRDIVLASYRAGATNLIDYLDAQRVFRDTLRTYNRALYDQRIALFQLAAATGEPSPQR